MPAWRLGLSAVLEAHICSLLRLMLGLRSDASRMFMQIRR